MTRVCARQRFGASNDVLRQPRQTESSTPLPSRNGGGSVCHCRVYAELPPLASSVSVSPATTPPSCRYCQLHCHQVGTATSEGSPAGPWVRRRTCIFTKPSPSPLQTQTTSRCPFRVTSKKTGQIYDCNPVCVKVSAGASGEAYCNSCKAAA
jgi:hypothetical protein